MQREASRSAPVLWRSESRSNRTVGGSNVSGVYKSVGTGFQKIIEGPVDLSVLMGGQSVPFGTVTDLGLAAINASGDVATELNWQQGVNDFGAAFVGKGPITSQSYINDQFSIPIQDVRLGAGQIAINSMGSVWFYPYVYVPISKQNENIGQRQWIGVGVGLDDNNRQVMFSGGTGQGGTVSLIKLDYARRAPTVDILDLKPVSTNVIGSIPVGVSVSDFEINGQGIVVFRGDGMDGSTGIYWGTGAPAIVSPFSTFRTGVEFSGLSFFAINEAGRLAFYAFSASWDNVGIFSGPDPYADKIVLNGDIVAGETVSGIRLPPKNGQSIGHWFNSSGEVVFLANDATGTGLYVTSSSITPTPPEPASTVIEWQGPGDPAPGTPPNGSFTQTNAWKPLNGDPPRVPQENQTLNDTALFDRPEVYTVDLQPVENTERLIIKDGNVTFTNGSITLDAPYFDNPSVIIDNARLTLSYDTFLAPIAYTVSCRHALIGQSAAARVDVVNNASWSARGMLLVGGPGEGILTIDSGGFVTNSESLIGGAGGGHVNVGPEGIWDTGNIAIGAAGQGDLSIQDGGNVHSLQGVIGQDPGLGDAVIVQGDGSAWNLTTLTVGLSGNGSLTITNGATVTATAVDVAGAPQGNLATIGSVEVGGLGTNTNSSALNAGYLTVGEAGKGQLMIQDGGVVNVSSEALIGYLTNGTATVSGINAGVSSLLSVGQGLTLGALSSGSLLIAEGGQVKSQSGSIMGLLAGQTSEVTIISSGSAWVIDGTLEIGLGGVGVELPEDGSAVLSLVDGYVHAGSVAVNHGGMIIGSGTLAVDTANRFTNGGGTISPGFSPGTITIDGSFEQLAGGRLLMDIGGTNYADCDHLIITNAAFLDGNITFRFLNGFAPKAGQQFSFLSVGGTLTGEFASVTLENLAPGFQFGLITNGPALSMVASNDGVFSTALPGSVDLSVTNIGGVTYATYLVTTSNTCQRISLDGGLIQSNGVFNQGFVGTTMVLGGECDDEVQTVTNTVLLGALAPGDYTFNITSVGQIVNTLPFNVPGEVGNQTLMTPTLLSDGSVQFQIQGPALVPYAIEASTDLTNWVQVATGVLPGTFTDPDATIFPQRFYRAVIGP